MNQHSSATQQQLIQQLRQASQHLQQGQLPAAQQLFMAILQIAPKQPDALFGLAQIAQQQGDLNKALALLEQTVVVAPGHAHARAALARLLSQAKQFAASNTHYDWLIRNKGPHHSVLYYKAVNHAGMQEHQSAVSALAQAIQLAPQEAALYELMGQEQFQLQHYDEAAKAYQQAHRLGARSPNLYGGITRAMQTVGRIEEARQYYREAAAHFPQQLELRYQHWRIENTAVAKNDAPAIKQAMEATTDGEQKAYGAFLLAAIANQEQQYAQEFALLQEGHALYKGHHTFRYSDTHYLKRLPEMARARQLDHTPSNSNNDALASMQPVFIVGTPRCGSTLLESMLKSGAPELIDTEESGVMLHAADLSQCDNSETWLQTYRERIRAAYRDFGVEAPQCRFSDKTLDHFFVLDLILKVFPQAKVIWMRRHPYAVTMSILKNNMIHLPWAHDVNQIFEYIDLQNTLMAHWKDQFGDAILELEYESLASDPETQAKRVFEFCELEWNASALNFHKQTTKASKTASAAQIREGINTRAIRAYEPYIAQLDQAQKASDEQQLS